MLYFCGGDTLLVEDLLYGSPVAGNLKPIGLPSILRRKLTAETCGRSYSVIMAVTPSECRSPMGMGRTGCSRVRLASGTHGGFDSVGLLHRMSSSVRRLRSDCPILSVFGPLVAAELCTGRSESSKIRCKGLNGQWPNLRRHRTWPRQPRCFNLRRLPCTRLYEMVVLANSNHR
jgi:hypothetical protein